MINVPSPADVLSQLYATIESRKRADAGSSYIASLYEKGVDTIAKKVGEEAAETIIAARMMMMAHSSMNSPICGFTPWC